MILAPSEIREKEKRLDGVWLELNGSVPVEMIKNTMNICSFKPSTNQRPRQSRYEPITVPRLIPYVTDGFVVTKLPLDIMPVAVAVPFRLCSVVIVNIQ